MKKPVRKRRGYDSGGIVSAGRRLYGQMSDIARDRQAEQNALQASIDRFAAKDYEGQAMNMQRADIAGDRMTRRQGMPTKYPADQPEGYPAPTFSQGAAREKGYGQAKGGKVKKVIPARKRR